MRRIEFLDGFRGLAIIVVMLFHTFVIHNDALPFAKFAEFPVFKYGYLGVELFFMISGFVILMTLEKTPDFLTFMKKRWVRLFPAMLIATVFTFAVGQFLPERPEGIPALKSTIPGLIFTEPEWIKFFTGAETGLLEGAFWSLFVEMKFYIIFGLLYYFFNKFAAIGGILFLYLLWFGTVVLSHFGLPLKSVLELMQSLSFIYFGWFASGAVMYLYFEKKEKKYLFAACIIALLSIFSQGLDSVMKLFFAFLIPVIFISTIYFDGLKKLFNNRFFLFIGFISYPLYLIHESNMIGMMVKEYHLFPQIPAFLLPIIPWILVILIAYIITKYVEPPLHNFIRKIILK